MVKLCKVINFRNFEKKIYWEDPGIYLDRYISKLDLGEMASRIAFVALKIIMITKKLWCSKSYSLRGIYGASIYLALKCFGIKRNIKKIQTVANVSYSTLRSRLSDYKKFENYLIIYKNKIFKNFYRFKTPTIRKLYLYFKENRIKFYIKIKKHP